MTSKRILTTLKTISAKAAAQLDQDLMSPQGAFSIDQLMELAGLSVSQAGEFYTQHLTRMGLSRARECRAVYKVHPPSMGRKVLVICGPGNNGGDGLVAARHLWHYGYQPEIYYPKQGRNELYQRLTVQLQNLQIPFTTDESFATTLNTSDHIIDAIFGFSFSGPVRAPFGDIISELSRTDKPVTSVDIPSAWDVDFGPPASGVGSDFMPNFLVSLTAPKPCVRFFTAAGKQGGHTRHFWGGRFVSPVIAAKYGLALPEYHGIDQVVEVPVEMLDIEQASEGNTH